MKFLKDSVSPKKPKEHEFAMCLLCGRSDLRKRFGPMYAIRWSIKRFLGRGRGGIDWIHKDGCKDAAFLRWMIALVAGIHKRLVSKLRALGQEAEPLEPIDLRIFERLPEVERPREVEHPREVERLPEVEKLRFIE